MTAEITSTLPFHTHPSRNLVDSVGFHQIPPESLVQIFIYFDHFWNPMESAGIHQNPLESIGILGIRQNPSESADSIGFHRIPVESKDSNLNCSSYINKVLI
jgi:hypothetical protein